MEGSLLVSIYVPNAHGMHAVAIVSCFKESLYWCLFAASSEFESGDTLYMRESGVDASGASARGAVLISFLVEPLWSRHPISTAKLPFPLQVITKEFSNFAHWFLSLAELVIIRMATNSDLLAFFL